MYTPKSHRERKIWLYASAFLAVLTLFGAAFWAPAHDQPTGLYWAISALMAVQTFQLSRTRTSETNKRITQ